MADDLDPTTWVHMAHPDVPNAEPALVALSAFEAVWSDLGWTLVDTPPAQTTASTPDQKAKFEKDFPATNPKDK